MKHIIILLSILLFTLAGCSNGQERTYKQEIKITPKNCNKTSDLEPDTIIHINDTTRFTKNFAQSIKNYVKSVKPLINVGINHYPVNAIPREYLKELYLLDLEYEQYYPINDYIVELPTLKEIVFDKIIFPEIKKKRKLYNLSLHDCIIKDYSWIENLESLSLAVMDINNLNLNKKSLKNLVDLWLIECKIEKNKLHDLLANCPNLSEVLALNCLELEDVPPAILKMKKLTRLDLANNNIKKIPDGILKLPKLIEINLKGNLLTHEEIQRILSLKRDNLSIMF